MAEKPKSMVLGVVAAAVFAGLGRMVIQKILSDRAARERHLTAPLDQETRAKISEALRTPRN
ncbi:MULTISPECIES: hypothetical protein [Micrococcaceae]|jgi:hypothetical protein|uniref:hypothetical protein n=1 Tax=Micrococcaceae TaxID=1268 RepID=UPI001F229A95|nr:MULTISPECIES: hypothetical protein [Micrococcaceae]MCF3140670.1 hypothetical protein [Paenarthrobacter sp. AR 02]MCR1162642.1 hypothetical protein [Paenarthrobacter sp. UW852]